MVSIEQQHNTLLVSYFNESGDLAKETIDISPRDQYNWVYCEDNDPDVEKVLKSFDGYPMKKVKAKWLTKYRQLEILHSLGEKTKKRIYAANKPKKYFMDIETSMKFGIPVNKLMDDPRESILTNSWCDQHGNITATGMIPLTDVQIERIEVSINKHFEKINRTYKLKYKYYESEKLMLNDLLSTHILGMPFISGWNFTAFDWAYIMARSEKLGLDVTRCAPTGKMENVLIKRKFAKKGEGVKTRKPLHKAIIDYQELYEKWDTSVAIKESARLDYVAQEVFGIKKVEYPGTLTEMYENDFEKFIFYNAVDCALVEVIDRKLGTFNTMLALSERATVPLNQALYMSLAIESMMSKKLLERGYILLKDQGDIEDGGKYEGGYVKEPGVGLFFNVLGFDFASLFPSIMLTLNTGVDTYLGKINADKKTYTDKFKNIHPIDENCIMAASGAVYDRTRTSIMKEILMDLIDSRLLAKTTADEIDIEVAELQKILKSKQAA